MCYTFFIHSSVDGHSGEFHVLVIVNSAAMNIMVRMSFLIKISLSVCSGVRLRDYLVTLFLVFWGTHLLLIARGSENWGQLTKPSQVLPCHILTQVSCLPVLLATFETNQSFNSPSHLHVASLLQHSLCPIWRMLGVTISQQVFW